MNSFVFVRWCVWMYERMEVSDDDDFVLTQQPVREYSDTQSADFGCNITEDNDIVSLETNGGSQF